MSEAERIEKLEKSCEEMYAALTKAVRWIEADIADAKAEEEDGEEGSAGVAEMYETRRNELMLPMWNYGMRGLGPKAWQQKGQEAGK